MAVKVDQPCSNVTLAALVRVALEAMSAPVLGSVVVAKLPSRVMSEMSSTEEVVVVFVYSK